MIETLREYLSRLGSDFLRVGILLLLMLGVASLDDWFKISDQYAYLSVLFTSSSLVLAFAAISHIIRRLLFPNIDLREYAWIALREPIGAAIVYFGICIVLSTFVVVNVLVLN